MVGHATAPRGLATRSIPLMFLVCQLRPRLKKANTIKNIKSVLASRGWRGASRVSSGSSVGARMASGPARRGVVSCGMAWCGPARRAAWQLERYEEAVAYVSGGALYP